MPAKFTLALWIALTYPRPSMMGLHVAPIQSRDMSQQTKGRAHVVALPLWRGSLGWSQLPIIGLCGQNKGDRGHGMAAAESR